MTTALLAQLSPEMAHQALAVVGTRLRIQAERTDIHAWRRAARAAQIPPEGDWQTWYLVGGRGAGKTYASAHTLAEWAVDFPGEYGVVAPAYADARDVCIEGESGLLAALGTRRVEVEDHASRYVESWNRSMGELRLRNGSVIFADGADDGANPAPRGRTAVPPGSRLEHGLGSEGGRPERRGARPGRDRNPGAQGIYVARTTGTTFLSAVGSPPCTSGACPLVRLGFSITITVN